MGDAHTSPGSLEKVTSKWTQAANAFVLITSRFVCASQAAFFHSITNCACVWQVFVRVGSSARSRDASSDSEMTSSTSSAPQLRNRPSSQHKFNFNIGSIDSFERKMEEAQEALGLDPNEFIPITYVNELSWSQELLRLLPTLLLIGGYVWFTRRSMGGGGLGGGGLGGGGRGIFNVGKAQVGTLDKNAKDKIMFKVSYTWLLLCIHACYAAPGYRLATP